MPVPGIASAPLEASCFYVRLRDFPPTAYFAAALDFFFEQFLIFWFDESIVLQQIGAFQMMFTQAFGLTDNGLEEHLVGVGFDAGLGASDEIDDIDNSGR